MTTLDLNAYGVTEMSHAEKVENNGGFWWQIVVIAAEIGKEIYDNWDEVKEKFNKGFSGQ